MTQLCPFASLNWDALTAETVWEYGIYIQIMIRPTRSGCPDAAALNFHIIWNIPCTYTEYSIPIYKELAS